MNRKWGAAACTIALVFDAGAAAAQSLDYGALEQLFGEPVTTSVTGSPQRASDVPAAMEIITADDIRRSGAIDIPGVLSHVVGVDVLQWTNNAADVSVRGYDQPYSPRLLVLIDGRQVYADWYGFTPWSALPVELAAIRQIEVVKGPQSALFGFNAAGGVINIITYNPLYDDVNTASLTGGTQALAQGSAVATFKLGDYGAVRLSAGGRANDEFSTPIPAAEAGAPRPGNNRGAIDADAVFRLSEKVQLGLEVSHTEADQNDLNPLYILGFSRYGTDSVMGRLAADTNIGLLQATAYTNWMRQSANISLALGNADFNNQVSVVQLQDIFKLGADHTLRGTVEYRHNTDNTTPLGGANVLYDVVSAGGMWAWQIVPSLSLTNALRIDHLMLSRDGLVPPGYPFSNSGWDRAFSEPSFNSGLVWNLDAGDTLRLTASRGVQVPSLATSGAILAVAPAANLTGIPTLDPTIVTNYEIGWDHALNSLAAQFRASAFHENTTDIVAPSGGLILTAGAPYITPVNVGSSTANGLELDLKGRLPENWRWGVNYRLEGVTDHFDAGETNLATLTDFQHTTPVHVINANLGWSRGKWEIDGYLHYQSSTFGLLPSGTASVLTPISDYVSIDGRIGYKLTDWLTLAVSGQNLSRSTQQQTSAPNVERRVLGTISVKF